MNLTDVPDPDDPGDEVTDEVHHHAQVLRRARARALLAAPCPAELPDPVPCGVLLRGPDDARWRRVGSFHAY